MKTLLLLSFLFFWICFGQPTFPCAPFNTSNVASVTACNGVVPYYIGPQTRYCGLTVAAGQSVFFAFILQDNNAQLNDLQFGITVLAKNATALDGTDFISVYVAETNCPSPICPQASNAFATTCGYDHLLTYGDVTSVFEPLTTTYRNAQDGVYYIQVVGPSGTGQLSIAFDIQIDDGAQTVSRFVPPITVLLFCFVFAVVIIILYVWKKKHGAWGGDPKPSKKKKLEETGTSSRGLVLDLAEIEEGGLNRRDSLASLESVVNLFREQTAAIEKLTKQVSGLSTPMPISGTKTPEKEEEEEEETTLKKKKPEEKNQDNNPFFNEEKKLKSDDETRMSHKSDERKRRSGDERKRRSGDERVKSKEEKKDTQGTVPPLDDSSDDSKKS